MAILEIEAENNIADRIQEEKKDGNGSRLHSAAPLDRTRVRSCNTILTSQPPPSA